MILSIVIEQLMEASVSQKEDEYAAKKQFIASRNKELFTQNQTPFCKSILLELPNNEA